MADLNRALHIFSMATTYVRDAGLQKEIAWERQVSLDRMTETDLLRESAWVILCSGFSAHVVRGVFSHISLCFCDWESAEAIVDSYPACRIAATAAFRNEVKLDAIAHVAHRVHRTGFSSMKEAIVRDPIPELRRLPYIGPVTALHLAKNLGVETAKPDRHLTRMSEALGYRTTAELCESIAEARGETIRIVDLILWRYIVDTRWSSPAVAGH